MIIFYNLAYSPAYSSAMMATQLILSVILTLLTLGFAFIYNSFYNLNFSNKVLVSSGLQFTRYSFFRPVFYFLQCALTLKPNQTPIEQWIFLGIIAIFSGGQLIRSLGLRAYFDAKINFINIQTKLIKTIVISCLCFTSAFGFGYSAFILLILVLMPVGYGITMYMISFYEERIFRQLIITDRMKQFEDENDTVLALYMTIDLLNSEESLSHAKLLSLIIQYEENTIDEGQSYYKAIAHIIKINERQLNYDPSGNNQDQEAMLDSNYDSFVKLQSVSVGDELESGFDLDSRQLLKVSMANVMRGDSRSSLNNVLLDGGSLQVSKVFSLISNIGEGVNTKFEDLFQTDGATAIRNQQLNFDTNRNIIKINGFDLDLTDLERAIKMIKLRFISEVLLKQAIAKYPTNFALMLLQSYLSLDIFQNKYLALTSVTHISTLSKKLTYKEQIQTLISVNYFVGSIIAKTNLQSLTSSAIGGQGNRELDSSLLLQESLHIDQVINKIKVCSLKIMFFWQLLSQESVSRENVAKLQNASTDISQLLRVIRNYVKEIENIESVQSHCMTLSTYLSYFYLVVVRDRNLGNIILKSMSCISSFGLGSASGTKLSQIDEIGVVVVDANFNLYGKVMFANKIITKKLGYNIDDLKGKMIHALMPSIIAEIHNKFWTAFARVGLPKILDSTRFLYVKDAQGYIAPYKVFVKFQHDPKFGYTFVGLLTKVNRVTLDEHDSTTRKKRTYHMLCNRKGKILEISQSVNALMHLTPTILENLHAQIEANLTLSFFNNTLVFDSLDFSKHNCMFYKNFTLDFTELKERAKVFEIYEDGPSNAIDEDDSNTNPFKKLPNRLNVSMKIIKEVYGNQNSQVLNLFFVVFKEQIEGKTDMKMSFVQLVKKESLHNNDQDLLSGDSEDEKNTMMGSIASGNEKMTNISISSAGSSTARSEQEIKVVEEGIDYGQIPKPLIFLKYLTLFLFVSLTVLSSVQYGINQMQQQQNIDFQSYLIRNIQSEELITQLTLLSRIYVDINLGLEPVSTTFVPNRKQAIITDALPFIETIQQNLTSLHQYLIQNFPPGDNNGDGINERELLTMLNVTMYNLLSNDVLDSSLVSRFYSINTWLVNAYQVFIFNNFTSNIGTYLRQGSVTSFDQALFYVLVNAQNDMLSQVQILNNIIQIMIDEQLDSAISLNKYYVAISSVLTVVFTLSSLYFLTVIFRFKSGVLTFFAEIDPELQSLAERSARDFFIFVCNDDITLIEANRVKYDAYIQKLSDSKDQDSSKLAPSIKKQASQFMDHEDIKKSGMINVWKKNDEEVKEEVKLETGSTSKSRKKKVRVKDNKLKTREKPLSLESTLKGNKRSIKQEELVTKDKSISRTLNDQTLWKITQFSIFCLIASFILITYFVVEYFLFQQQQQNVKDNTSQIVQLYKSMECTNQFLFDIRSLQVSNNSWYNLDNSSVGYPLQFNEEMQSIKSNSLNETYFQCISLNQRVSQWLQVYQGGAYNLGGPGQNTTSICSFANQNQPDEDFNLTSCNQIYQGTLDKTIIQSSSVFLQDSLYMAIKYLTPDSSQRTVTFINQSMSNPNNVDLTDAHSLYQQPNLRKFYNYISGMVFASQQQGVTTILFIIFISILLTVALIVQCIVIERVKISFWHAFYILRLIPKDEVDTTFIKRINQYLSKA